MPPDTPDLIDAPSRRSPVLDLPANPAAALALDPDIPLSLAQRPWDPRRKVPIPFVNEHTDRLGNRFVDLIGVDPARSEYVARHRLCGLCGGPMSGLLAFVGLSASAEAMVFSDPPAHEDCALAALRWCPHIKLRHHKRATASRLHPETAMDAGQVGDKRHGWAIGTANRFALSHWHGTLVFLPERFTTVRSWAYTGDGESLIEVTGTPAAIEGGDPLW